LNVDKKPVTIHGAPKGYLSLSASKYYLDAIGVGIKFNDENGYADLGYTLYRWWTGL
jgi:hypothetical protein